MLPIENPLLVNLIYICYANFEELIFYKPVQNLYSKEFYIVGKGYKGLKDNVIESLLFLAENYDEYEYIDMFDDKYPEAFVYQMISGIKDLVEKIRKSLEKQLYFADNLDILDKRIIEQIDNYIKEKNIEWIKKYNIKKISNRDNLIKDNYTNKRRKTVRYKPQMKSYHKKTSHRKTSHIKTSHIKISHIKTPKHFLSLIDL